MRLRSGETLIRARLRSGQTMIRVRLIAGQTMIRVRLIAGQTMIRVRLIAGQTLVRMNRRARGQRIGRSGVTASSADHSGKVWSGAPGVTGRLRRVGSP